MHGMNDTFDFPVSTDVSLKSYVVDLASYSLDQALKMNVDGDAIKPEFSKSGIESAAFQIYESNTDYIQLASGVYGHLKDVPSGTPAVQKLWTDIVSLVSEKNSNSLRELFASSINFPQNYSADQLVKDSQYTQIFNMNSLSAFLDPHLLIDHFYEIGLESHNAQELAPMAEELYQKAYELVYGQK